MVQSWYWETNRSSVNIFPAFYVTRTFVTTFTIAHHLSQYWVKSMMFMSYSICWSPCLVIFSHLCLRLPRHKNSQPQDCNLCLCCNFVLLSVHGTLNIFSKNFFLDIMYVHVKYFVQSYRAHYSVRVLYLWSCQKHILHWCIRSIHTQYVDNTALYTRINLCKYALALQVAASIFFMFKLRASLEMPKTTVLRILRNSLRIKPHKLHVVQNLTGRGKQIR